VLKIIKFQTQKIQDAFVEIVEAVVGALKGKSLLLLQSMHPWFLLRHMIFLHVLMSISVWIEFSVTVTSFYSNTLV